MSSLWSRGPGGFSVALDVPVKLQLRSIPQLTTTTSYLHSSPKQNMLAELFSDMKTSWMYGAAVQLALNGSEPAWSRDGWSFVPNNLQQTPSLRLQNTGNDTIMLGYSTNVTINTAAIRARLECSSYEPLNLSNETRWITKRNLTDPDRWNVTANPSILQTGYELGLDQCTPGPCLLDPKNGASTILYLGRTLNGSGPYTTFFAHEKRLRCCENVTDEEIGPGSVGYWSPNLGGNRTFPNNLGTWPVNFTVKWIHGRPVEGYRAIEPLVAGEVNTIDPRLMWAEVPQMTVLNCAPIIETANASVTVDQADGRVIDFNITDAPVPEDSAWSDDFAVHDSGLDGPTYNVTVSHGVLFVMGLLGAADTGSLGGLNQYATRRPSEDMADRTYNIRIPGLNADYMSYSMLSLVDHDHQALLDPDRLARTASQTFSTFFQHFSTYNVSLDTGGYVYTPLGAKLPDDLDGPGSTSKRADSAPPPSATQAIALQLPIEKLYISETAAWFCLVILGYLLVTSTVLIVASRRYAKVLWKRVETIADVAALVAGSERLLSLVNSKELKDLKQDSAARAKLGWFKDNDGTTRWGIELVDGEEVHVPNKGTKEQHQTNQLEHLDTGCRDTESLESWYDPSFYATDAPIGAGSESGHSSMVQRQTDATQQEPAVLVVQGSPMNPDGVSPISSSDSFDNQLRIPSEIHEYQ